MGRIIRKSRHREGGKKDVALYFERETPKVRKERGSNLGKDDGANRYDVRGKQQLFRTLGKKGHGEPPEQRR